MNVFKKTPVPAHRQGVPAILYWLVDRLEGLRLTQVAITDQLKALYRTNDLLIEYQTQFDERMRYMQRSWDELVQTVADLKTWPASVKAGFDSLEAKLAAAIDALGSAPSVAEVDALKADVAKAVSDIKGAIPANVP